MKQTIEKKISSTTFSKIPTRKLNGGFTLIELLIVIAIISILASVLIPNLTSARVKSATAAQKSEMQGLSKEALIYWSNNSESFSGLCASGSTIDTFMLSIASKTGSVTTSNIIRNLSAGTAAQSPLRVKCNAGTNAITGLPAYAVDMPLKDGTFVCVDSSGNRVESASAILSTQNTDYSC